MARVEFDDVSKVFDDGTRAVDKLDLQIADGEFMVLVGPSGCGKTTALRMVAGLEDISDGVVRIGERVVNDLTPKRRDIAMVFQSYALYPHLSVRDNIAFPLKIAKVPKDEIRRRVAEAARILDLEPYLKRKPRALSGGQRQRVAMGRAIVRQPAVFLMDEPLSNLDAKLRVQMRADIKKIQSKLGVTIDLRHARPGRGDDDGRSRRRHAQGRAAAGRPAAGAVRPAGQPLRRRLHREPGDEHARGARRASRRWRGRRARRRPSRAVRSSVARARTTDAPSCSASGRRTSRTRPSRTTTAARGSAAASSCERRSGPRCSSTSRSRRARPSPTTCASWPRTSATTACSVRTRRARRSSAGSARGPAWSRATAVEVSVDRNALHFFDSQTGLAIRGS